MICLDSDCIIDVLKGVPHAVECVRRYRENLFTTQINLFEVMQGALIRGSSKEIQSTEIFFSDLDVLPLTDGREAAVIMAKLVKEGNEIGSNDCLIAAIMRKVGCTQIITKNGRHFSRISGIT